MDLLEETIRHFHNGARSVTAYAPGKTYIITRQKDTEHYWVVTEEEGFGKTKADSLEEYFTEVFGIAAKL